VGFSVVLLASVVTLLTIRVLTPRNLPPMPLSFLDLLRRAMHLRAIYHEIKRALHLQRSPEEAAELQTMQQEADMHLADLLQTVNVWLHQQWQRWNQRRQTCN
jgi:hypothetical protein